MKLPMLVIGCASLLACGTKDGASPPPRQAPPDASTDAGAGASAAPTGGAVVTLAGTSEGGDADGSGAEARFNNPVNVAVGPDGNVYVSDYDNGLLRVVTAAGAVTTLTRQGDFAKPFGLAFTPDGTLYVETDTDETRERGNQVGCLWRVDRGGHATMLARRVGRPRGLAGLADGRVAFADPAHHVVGIFTPATRQLTVIAGVRDQAGYADGDGAAARFNGPSDVVATGDGLVVTDQGNHRLRAVTLAGRVTTLAGSGRAGSDDGERAAATFDRPQGLARDRDGNLYVTGMGGYRVRVVTPSGRVTTLAGAGRAGYLDGAALDAQFTGLEGIDVAPDGAALFIADGTRGEERGNHRVRRLTLER